MLVYPKDDLLIKLSSLNRPERVVLLEEINPTIDRTHAKGLVLNYIDGKAIIEVAFKTFSSNFLEIDNTGGATCDDLLVDL